MARGPAVGFTCFREHFRRGNAYSGGVAAEPGFRIVLILTIGHKTKTHQQLAISMWNIFASRCSGQWTTRWHLGRLMPAEMLPHLICSRLMPREGDDVGHAVFVAGEPMHLFETMVQYPGQAFHLVRVALDTDGPGGKPFTLFEFGSDPDLSLGKDWWQIDPEGGRRGDRG